MNVNVWVQKIDLPMWIIFHSIIIIVAMGYVSYGVHLYYYSDDTWDTTESLK